MMSSTMKNWVLLMIKLMNRTGERSITKKSAVKRLQRSFLCLNRPVTDSVVDL